MATSTSPSTDPWAPAVRHAPRPPPRRTRLPRLRTSVAEQGPEAQVTGRGREQRQGSFRSQPPPLLWKSFEVGVPKMHCQYVHSHKASPSTTRSVTRRRDSGRGGPSHVPSPAVECTLASSASTVCFTDPRGRPPVCARLRAAARLSLLMPCSRLVIDGCNVGLAALCARLLGSRPHTF